MEIVNIIVGNLPLLIIAAIVLWFVSNGKPIEFLRAIRGKNGDTTDSRDYQKWVISYDDQGNPVTFGTLYEKLKLSSNDNHHAVLEKLSDIAGAITSLERSIGEHSREQMAVLNENSRSLNYLLGKLNHRP